MSEMMVLKKDYEQLQQLYTKARALARGAKLTFINTDSQGLDGDPAYIVDAETMKEIAKIVGMSLDD